MPLSRISVAESGYETGSESLVAFFPIWRNHSVIQQRLLFLCRCLEQFIESLVRKYPLH